MFGFFMFAQPMFADVPQIGGNPPSGGGGGGGDAGRHSRHHLDRREQETRIEIMLLTFLNTQ